MNVPRNVWGLLSVAMLLGSGCGGATSNATQGHSSSVDSEVHFEDEAAPEAQSGPPATPEVLHAEQLLAAGNGVEAARELREYLRGHANDTRAHLDLGLALELQNDAQGAMREYRAALSIDTTFAEAANNLGALLREEGELVQAIRTLQEAVRMRPRFASARFNLAMALEEHGDTSEALAAYETTIEDAPRAAMPRVNYGLLLVHLTRNEEAVRAFRAALPLARGDRAALLAIGNGFRRAGEGESAVRAVQAAIAAGDDGPTPALLSELALAQRAANDRPGAEASLAQAIVLDARYATAHYLLANMLAGRQAYAEAIEHWRAYLQLEPRGDHAADAREKIRAAESAASR
ncbi:MAG: tetratricopeptide repeat protein [Sandaracinaceae bacterium]|nr:tetratricopeptide repeat protein [Sandaracinaceae bacterium]